MSLEETLAKKRPTRRPARKAVATALAAAPSEWVRIGGSPDLARQRTWPTVLNRDGVAYVYGGDGANDFLISYDDGARWTKVTGNWPPRAATVGALHQGKFWIVGGFSPGKGFSDTLYSSDWTNWNAIPGAPGWGVRWAQCLLSYGGQLLLIAGVNGPVYANDVWALGADNVWRKLSEGRFKPRAWAAGAVLGNTLMLMGGWNDTDRALAETIVSTDGGISWATFKSPFPARFGAAAVTVGDTVYLIGGQDIHQPGATIFTDTWATKDGVTWTRVDNTLPVRNCFGAMAIDGRIILAGGGTTAAGSPDTLSLVPPPDPHPRGWTLLSSNLPQDGLAASATLGDKLVVLGAQETADPSNLVSLSADGQSWTTQAAPWPARRAATAVSIGNALYVVGGLSDKYPTTDNPCSDIWATLDGVKWSQVADNAPWAGERDVQAASNGQRIVAWGGRDAYGKPARKMWSYTPQPVRWAPPATYPMTVDYPGVADLGGVTYTICGRGRYGTDVTKTTDFQTWQTTRVGMQMPQASAAATRDGRIWVTGGDPTGAAYWSTDGATWTPAAQNVDLLARSGHAMVVFKGDLVVIAGTYWGYYPQNQPAVVRSGDGVSWTGVTSDLDGRRSWQAAAVLGDKLWLFGGSFAGEAMQEAWCTTDLQHWEKHTPPWAGRFLARAHVVNGVLYLLGGVSTGSGSIYQEVWATRDGLSWVLVDKGGPGQYGGGSAVRDTTIIVYGGNIAPWQTGNIFRYLTPDT